MGNQESRRSKRMCKERVIISQAFLWASIRIGGTKNMGNQESMRSKRMCKEMVIISQAFLWGNQKSGGK